MHTYEIGAPDKPMRFVPTGRRALARRVDTADYVLENLERSAGAERRLVASGTSTIDPTSTQTVEVAGPAPGEPRDRRVTSGGPLRPGPLLLRESSGRSELVCVESTTTSGTPTIVLTTPLRHSYAAGAQLRGIEHTATFPATAAPDGSYAGHEYRLLWSYTIDGETHLFPESVSVSRHSTQPPITAQFIIASHPYLPDRIGVRGTISGAISLAYDEYLAELEAHDIPPQDIIPGKVVQLAIRERALYHCYRWIGDADLKSDAKDEANRWMKAVIRGCTPRGNPQIHPRTDTAKPAEKRRRPALRRT
ncbi:MAG: hypothetical protein AAGF11_54465 [Myxococcota bacterium]